MLTRYRSPRILVVLGHYTVASACNAFFLLKRAKLHLLHPLAFHFESDSFHFTSLIAYLFQLFSDPITFDAR